MYSFCQKFRYPILSYLLKEPRFDLQLYFSKNLISFTSASESTDRNKTQLSKQELLNKDTHPKQVFSSDKTLTESDVDAVVANGNDSVFQYLSSATNVLWSDEILKKYTNQLDWNRLCFEQNYIVGR